MEDQMQSYSILKWTWVDDTPSPAKGGTTTKGKGKQEGKAASKASDPKKPASGVSSTTKPSGNEKKDATPQVTGK